MAITEWITTKGSLRYARLIKICIITEGEHLKWIKLI